MSTIITTVTIYFVRYEKSNRERSSLRAPDIVFYFSR